MGAAEQLAMAERIRETMATTLGEMDQLMDAWNQMIDDQRMLDFQMALFEVQETSLNLPEVDWQTNYDNGRALLDDVEHFIRRLVSNEKEIIAIKTPTEETPEKDYHEGGNFITYSPATILREFCGPPPDSPESVKMDASSEADPVDKDPIVTAESGGTDSRSESGESVSLGEVHGTEQVAPGDQRSLFSTTINDISLKIAAVV